MPSLIGLVAAAAAQDLVVHPSGETATDGVSTSLPALLSVAPATARGAGWSACTTATRSRSAIDAALAEAEGAMRYLELERATVALRGAAEGLGCLGERVDPSVASRVHYLRGVLAADRGAVDEARRAFERALAFSPALVWDDDLPPEAAPLFAEVSGGVRPSVPFHLVPHGAPVWIDGRALGSEGTIASGEHLVQIDGPIVTTYRLEVDTRPVWLLVPDRVASAPDDWFSDPHRVEDLGFLLVAALGEGRIVDVLVNGAVHRTTTGSPGFTRIGVPILAPVPRRGRAAALTWGGAAIGVGGAALATLSYIQGLAALDETKSPETWAAYYGGQRQRNAAVTRLAVGEALAGGGAAMAGVGLVITFRTRPERP